MVLSRLFARKVDISEALYAAIMAAARQEKFYAQWHVPDTMDGRFDVLILHVYLVLDRLKALGKDAEPLAQALANRFFADMDATLRQVGVGDLVVGKKVRKMAEAFYGRATSYTKAIGQGETALAEALERNVYEGAKSGEVMELARWTLNARDMLALQNLAALAQGEVRFE